MNEERANLGSIALRVQQGILAAGPMIAAEESFALAPAAAANDDPFRARTCRIVLVFHGPKRLSNNIRAIDNELAVHTEDGFQCAFDLRRSVVLRLQAADRSFNQLLQYQHIF